MNNTELSPNEQKRRKGNHDLKWSSPFDYQPKSRALATFFRPALNKKNRKRKKPEKSKAEKLPKRTHSKGKSYLIHDHTCNFLFDRK
ncbi:hypothetical protein L2P99_13420 [Staphylococcus aureus]|nr:hypothetical protein [Staphylococcus aureus]